MKMIWILFIVAVAVVVAVGSSDVEAKDFVRCHSCQTSQMMLTGSTTVVRTVSHGGVGGGGRGRNVSLSRFHSSKTRTAMKHHGRDS